MSFNTPAFPDYTASFNQSTQTSKFLSIPADPSGGDEGDTSNHPFKVGFRQSPTNPNITEAYWIYGGSVYDSPAMVGILSTIFRFEVIVPNINNFRSVSFYAFYSFSEGVFFREIYSGEPPEDWPVQELGTAGSVDFEDGSSGFYKRILYIARNTDGDLIVFNNVMTNLALTTLCLNGLPKPVFVSV